jgi:uncharacterized protein YqfB (UPF0267 family)
MTKQQIAMRKVASQYDLVTEFHDETNAFTLQTWSDYSVGLYPNILADVNGDVVRYHTNAIDEEQLTIEEVRDIIKEIKGG